MAVVIVGGHSRNIGKTSVVAGLIAALPHCHWTAIKITQFGHGVCSANGEPCDCQTADHALAVSEEHDRESGTDTSRFLAAGAVKSYWIRTRQGQLVEAMPRLRKLIAAAQNVMIESNSVLRFLQPTLSISVLDPSVMDFKQSAMRYLDRADALLIPTPGTQVPWPDISKSLIARKLKIVFSAPNYCPPELVSFVSRKLNDADPRATIENAEEVTCESC